MLVNAVLVRHQWATIMDISGVPHKCCTQEIRDGLSPTRLPFEARRLNIYELMISFVRDCITCRRPVARSLRQIADYLAKENTRLRMTLLEAISHLEAARIGKLCGKCK
jgi:hypothetical protein